MFYVFHSGCRRKTRWKKQKPFSPSGAKIRHEYGLIQKKEFRFLNFEKTKCSPVPTSDDWISFTRWFMEWRIKVLDWKCIVIKNSREYQAWRWGSHIYLGLLNPKWLFLFSVMRAFSPEKLAFWGKSTGFLFRKKHINPKNRKSILESAPKIYRYKFPAYWRNKPCLIVEFQARNQMRTNVALMMDWWVSDWAVCREYLLNRD